MESLQLSQVLADLSNLGAAEPEAAAAIVNADVPIIQPEFVRSDFQASSQQQQRPSSGLRRAWSSEAAMQPRFDKMGRRILISSPKSGSAANSTPGTPQPSNYDEDLERANTLMALYNIRAKLKQQDNSSLIRAREKINALAARQQAQQFAELNMKKAEEMRRNRYSFPKA
ncbi:hypothetical protein BBK36DRAFT_1122470 [Trichoderma citrinoviride]|uniref:Uncharacterized protein n=1 Tax=Trichoderma citrinoviride TaxID=58853 RepID=A0A2T4B7W7_9HYPO|nr:hypothetical protein BBK36DRAFT_1122470 [Trichoderma citrinoviride]PTB65415.1 hypothetical protein BBK36DRAFT_1122470 [Trichoderma citrinoviride]